MTSISVEPELSPALVALAMQRLALVQIVPSLTGQHLRQLPLPLRVMAAWTLSLLMQKLVELHP